MNAADLLDDVSLLASDPQATVHHIRFAAHVGDWTALVALLEELARRDFLHSDAMAAAAQVIAASIEPARIEARLVRHANPRLRRLALEARVAHRALGRKPLIATA